MNTPTPWQEIAGEIWNDDATKIIASNLVHPFAESGPVRSANTSLIIRCVNERNDLINALKEICGGYYEDALGRTSMTREDMQSVARAALAKAQA